MDRLSQFKGCLIGGAAGDALGYEVEFMREERIFSRYGKPGIREYALHHGNAMISDDTQMTMFTANGILKAAADTEGSKSVREHIADCYRDWLHTQMDTYDTHWDGKCAWLSNVRDLYSRRAPGNTCISALMAGGWGTPEKPMNNSCGCGGVMRVAPIGLYYGAKENAAAAQADRVGAEAAAVTHGHELGYISSAALVHIIYKLIEQPEMTIRAAVEDAIQAMKGMFAQAEALDVQVELLEKAIALSESDTNDLDAIHILGEGWTGHDALAIAVYCALRYPDDFDRAMIAAVNHKGDSDSTGAIAGNILGAKLGMEGIPAKYLEHLEHRDILLELAEDLYRAAREPASELAEDPVWGEKYIRGTYTPAQEDEWADDFGDWE